MPKAKGATIQDPKETPNVDSSIITENSSVEDIMNAARPTMGGHPNEIPPSKEEVVTEPEKKDGEPEVKVEGIPEPGKEEPPKKKDGEPEPPPPKKEGQEEPEPPAKSASELELEQRLKDTQRSFHEGREREKRQQDQIDKLTGQIGTLLETLSKPAPREERPVDKMAPIRGELFTMLESIEKLDQASPDYRDKAVKAYEGVFSKLSDMVESGVVSRVSNLQKEVDLKIDQRLSAKEKEREEKDATARQSDRANQVAKDSGLDMREGIKDKDGKTVNSLDYDIFWRFAPFAQGTTLDEKIDWTVNEVKRIKAEIGAPVVKAKEKAIETQKKNAVLEKGGNKPVERQEPVAPVSMGDALAKAERRIS